MAANDVFFLGFTYLSIFSFLFGLVVRFRRPMTISSQSSQLLERKKLYWGVLAWHGGILGAAGAHLLSFFFPNFMVALEATWLGFGANHVLGVAFGVLVVVGMAILIWRRLSEPRLRGVTTLMDAVVVSLLLAQVVMGMAVRIGLFDAYATWFSTIIVPYFVSVLTFHPQPQLIGSLPWLGQAHIFNAFLLLAFLPFSRLIHIVTVPLNYLVRPWLVRVGTHRDRALDLSSAVVRRQGVDSSAR
jgi:nitrate reductase gamma subunit